MNNLFKGKKKSMDVHCAVGILLHFGTMSRKCQTRITYKQVLHETILTSDGELQLLTMTYQTKLNKSLKS